MPARSPGHLICATSARVHRPREHSHAAEDHSATASAFGPHSRTATGPSRASHLRFWQKIIIIVSAWMSSPARLCARLVIALHPPNLARGPRLSRMLRSARIRTPQKHCHVGDGRVAAASALALCTRTARGLTAHESFAFLAENHLIWPPCGRPTSTPVHAPRHIAPPIQFWHDNTDCRQLHARPRSARDRGAVTSVRTAWPLIRDCSVRQTARGLTAHESFAFLAESHYERPSPEHPQRSRCRSVRLLVARYAVRRSCPSPCRPVPAHCSWPRCW